MSRAYHTTEIGAFLFCPESSVCGANGTTIKSCNSALSCQRSSSPTSSVSKANFHTPLRHRHCSRTNCGRGYSARGTRFFHFANNFLRFARPSFEGFQLGRLRFFVIIIFTRRKLKHPAGRLKPTVLTDGKRKKLFCRPKDGWPKASLPDALASGSNVFVVTQCRAQVNRLA